MYRSGLEYDEMAKLAIDVFVDYNISSFPIDVEELCQKLGIVLVPYSAYSRDDRSLLVKRSKSGFNEMKRRINPPLIVVFGNFIEGMTGTFINFRYSETFCEKYEQIRFKEISPIVTIPEVV